MQFEHMGRTHGSQSSKGDPKALMPCAMLALTKLLLYSCHVLATEDLKNGGGDTQRADKGIPAASVAAALVAAGSTLLHN